MTMSYIAILQHDFLTQAEMHVCSLHQELQWCDTHGRPLYSALFIDRFIKAHQLATSTEHHGHCLSHLSQVWQNVY